MKNSFDAFESEVMSKLLSEEPKYSELLMMQYDNARIVSRQFTGVGFFTDYEVLDKSLRIHELSDYHFGSVQVVVPQLHYGIGFVLFIKHGLIDFLEGYTYGEPFPINISEYQIVIDK
jgi:hypothetical protein